MGLERDILKSLWIKKEANALEISEELDVEAEKVVGVLKRLEASGIITAI